MKQKKIKINKKINFCNDMPIALIAGPCVIESEKLILLMAEKLKKISEQYKIDLIFKSSFDKANRTSINSFRGPGLSKGLEILEKVKEKFGLPILVDVHTPEQAAASAETADILQIPAFLCRQTDLIIAAAKTGKTVNVKKGQFLAPWDIQHTIGKLENSGNKNVLLTERGVCFGYNRWVVDMCGIYELLKTGYPVIFDATHSIQTPGGAGAVSGGNREYIFPLCRAAVAVGIAAVFIETHPDPDNALSDGKNMLELRKLPLLLEQITAIDKTVKTNVKK